MATKLKALETKYEALTMAINLLQDYRRALSIKIDALEAKQERACPKILDALCLDYETTGAREYSLILMQHDAGDKLDYFKFRNNTEKEA